MRFWIDITDAAGNKLGDGPITTALEWENMDPVDKAGSFRFSMPAGDPRVAVIRAKRHASCKALVMGTPTEIGAGIIDVIEPKIDVLGNVMLSISGDSLAREITYRSVGFLELSDGEGNGVTDAVAQVMGFAPEGWSVDQTVGTQEPEGNVYAAFAGESVLQALVKIGEKKGEHFRLQAGRKIAWLGKSLIPSGIRAVQDGDPVGIENNRDVCIVQDLTETQDTYDVCSRVYPFGSGIGDARLTMAACTRSVPDGFVLDKDCNCLISTAAEAEFGRIDKYIAFKDISPISNTDTDLESAANALFDQTYEYLRRHNSAEKSYNISVLKMESLARPGETLRVVFSRFVDGFKVFSIDRDLYILETMTRIDAGGIRTAALKVATVDRWPDSDADMLVGQMAEGRAMESHPQLNANAYVMAYREAMDNGKPANMDFWLGTEVLNVTQVALRFRIDPLRSTVKSVSGQSTTSSTGGGGTQTSSNGGGSYLLTSTRGQEHAHATYVNGTGWFQSSNSSDSHNHSLNTPNHSHTVDVPSHNHTVTPSISMQYGIYEESSGNTLQETDLVYQVNGGEAIGRATSIGGGWYEIDLTALVSNPITRRPLRQTNQIRISTSTAKKATITGQLVIRTVIQAIAVT